jgi:hypothetical protein
MTTNLVSILTKVALVIGLSNIGFSWYSRVTPETICLTLQKSGFVSHCESGTPWAFEVPRHRSQWRFYPTNPEIFGCYKMSESGALVRCQFEGAITQFASTEDLDMAIEYITKSHRSVNTDPKADLVKADTTLENFIPYVFTKQRLLIMMPITENGVVVQNQLESLLGPSN